MPHLWFIALIACKTDSAPQDTPDYNGTAVGNPGNLDVALVNPPADVTIQSALLAVASVRLTSCVDDSVTEVEVMRNLDVLGATSEPVPIPTGDWCFTEVDLFDAEDGDPASIWGDSLPVVEGPLVLEVQLQDETVAQWGVGLADLELDQAYSVDGTDLIIGIEIELFVDDLANDDLQSPETAAITDPAGGSDSDTSFTDSDEEESDTAGEMPPVVGYETQDVTSTSSFVVEQDDGSFAEADPADLVADAEEAASARTQSDVRGCSCAAGGAGPTSFWLALLLLPAWRRRRTRWPARTL